MNTIELAKMLMEKLDISYVELAIQCGLKRQTVYENLQRAASGKSKREGFHMMVLRLALKNGFEAEALTVLFGESKSLRVSSLTRAGIMYPDLTLYELSKLRNAEEVTRMSSLPAEVIKSIIEESRSKGKNEKK